jgi:hypothetical protein
VGVADGGVRVALGERLGEKEGELARLRVRLAERVRDSVAEGEAGPVVWHCANPASSSKGKQIRDIGKR